MALRLALAVLAALTGCGDPAVGREHEQVREADQAFQACQDRLRLAGRQAECDYVSPYHYYSGAPLPADEGPHEFPERKP
jgi:hypothetical protein